MRQYLLGAALVLLSSIAAFWLPARRARAGDPLIMVTRRMIGADPVLMAAPCGTSERASAQSQMNNPLVEWFEEEGGSGQ